VRVIEAEIKRVLHYAKQRLPDLINHYFSGENELPLDMNEFWELERVIRRQALKLLEEHSIENAPKELLKNLYETFEGEIDD